MKKAMCLVMLLAAAAMFGCGGGGGGRGSSDPESIDGVTIDKESVTVAVGGEVTLSATVSPSGAENKNVTWSSNNRSVAEVSSEGVVTANVTGTAVITVTTVAGNKTDSCTINAIRGMFGARTTVNAIGTDTIIYTTPDGAQ
ncbi:MAG: Ig-like domain-containing protein, partial [Spirochaetota bacterium]